MRNILVVLLLIAVQGGAQQVIVLTKKPGISLRGLSAVDDRIVWGSGTLGTVGRSSDGGVSWEWMRVPGYEDRDFRDIEAFDGLTAVIMAAGWPGLILRTTNGGITWTTVFENSTEGMFLNAMDFGKGSGMVIGDPVDGRFFLARTTDRGASWKEMPLRERPQAAAGEVCFAASGTNIRMLTKKDYGFVTGGSRSRLWWNGEFSDLQIVAGKESTGANSMAVRSGKDHTARLVVVGGDFKSPAERQMNCILTTNGGASWTVPSNGPYGYRSCVEFIGRDSILSCGINGVDISLDGGINWNTVTETGFHVCRRARRGSSVYLAGADGRVGKLEWAAVKK